VVKKVGESSFCNIFSFFFSSEQLPQEQILHLAVKVKVSFFLFIYLPYDVKVKSK